ncbi:probable cardiolipin synthase (CMP-forming) isoform X2 [Antedon mediterranea]|uniref:probable cardiolipin synthase (CMP-forming) isoform X2 n=1 Tax=Antedon mediterranea TaxID=105859 RepID=UPI003AF7D2AC
MKGYYLMNRLQSRLLACESTSFSWSSRARPVANFQTDCSSETPHGQNTQKLALNTVGSKPRKLHGGDDLFLQTDCYINPFYDNEIYKHSSNINNAIKHLPIITKSMTSHQLWSQDCRRLTRQFGCLSPIYFQSFSRREIQTKARNVTKKVEKKVKEWRENIMTIPNLLTTSRIILSPVLGYLVLNEYYLLSFGLFVFTGITDMLDGYIARNFKNQQSVLGSILDPLADKFLVGILMITLCMQGLIPVSLTALIIGRDIGLVLAGFYYRFISLPPPFTLQRFFDVRHATIQMQPTFLGKFHTAVTLALLGFTLGAPVFNYVDHSYLQMLSTIKNDQAK